MDNKQNPSQATDQGEDFKLERYKFILQEIHSLNENNHTHLNLFQTLTTAIIGGGVAIFVSWKNLDIEAALAIIGIRGLLGLLVILTLFMVFSIIAGIFSWVDYREEEVELLSKAVHPEFRKSPTLKNFWRWQETYLIVFVVIVVAVIYSYVENQVIPLIQ